MADINYKKVSFFYLIGNLFNKGMAFLTVPIFTRILSTSDYGIVTTYNSWIGILSMIVGFAIYMGIRAAFIDYKDRIDSFLSVSTTFTLFCGSFFIVILSVGSFLIRINVNYVLFFLCLLEGMANALMQNYSMYLMMKYKYRLRICLMILPNLFSVLFSIIAILFICKENLYMGKIIPTALVNIIFATMTVILIYSKSHEMYNRKFITYALKISMPLVLHGIALNVLSQSDRSMITWLADASQTGIYSLIYNFSMIATVLTTSLDGVWIPWFTTKLMHRHIDDINKLAKDYINLMTYAMVGVILIGPEIVKLLADKRYWEGIMIIPPVVLANYVIFAYTLYVNVEHYYKKTMYITVNTLIAAGSNIVLNYIFIPVFGYAAAAYTTLISYLIAFILHANYAKKLERELYPLRTFMAPLVHIIISVFLFYLYISNWLVRWAVFFIYFLYILYKERNKVRNLLLTRSRNHC